MIQLRTILLLSACLSVLTACSGLPDKKPVIAAEVEPSKPSLPTQSTPSKNVIQTQQTPKVRKITVPPIILRAPVTHTTATVKLEPIRNRVDLWKRMRDGFRLPELDTKWVRYYERQYTAKPEHIERIFTRAQWFLPSILEAVEKHGYPTEVALLPAIESAFKPDAKSYSGASGLWQFIGSTGRLYGMHENWWYDARRDPDLSTAAALQFLGELNKRFNGDWFLSFAGYNAGGSNIEKAIKRNKQQGKSTHFSALKLRKETTHYVPKLIAIRNIILNPKRYGVKLPTMPNSASIASFDAGTQTDLSLFSAKIGVDSDTIFFLNSAYKHGVTPPDGPHRIQVPTGKLALANNKDKQTGVSDKVQWAHHKVRPGDILGRISQRYNVSVAAIMRANKMTNSTLYPGKVLLIPTINGQTTSNTTSVTRAVQAKPSTTKKLRLTHQVRKGDTLWYIAKRYGVRVAQISRWNNILQSHTLRLGQRLLIYPHSS